MFGEETGAAGAESGEGALQIALARLLPALLTAQVIKQIGSYFTSSTTLKWSDAGSPGRGGSPCWDMHLQI